MKKKVIAALAQIRPILKANGSDVELLAVNMYGIVKVRISGENCHCNLQQIITVLEIEEALKEHVPAVSCVVHG